MKADNEKKYVLAMRIYLKNGMEFMADLALAGGTVETISWCNFAERSRYYFNGYTLIYDERPKGAWSYWVKEQAEQEENQ